MVPAGAYDSERIAKKTILRRWSKEDVRALKALARGGKKTTAIAHTLRRSVGATYQQTMRLGVMLGGGRGKRA
jgi:hypothetical protein